MSVTMKKQDNYVAIVALLVFIAAAVVMLAACAELPTEAPVAEEAFPIASASATDGRIEGGTQTFNWPNCPHAGMPAELACRDQGSTVSITSVDNNSVEGDRAYTVHYWRDTGNGQSSVQRAINVLDDDTAYVSFRERVTGSFVDGEARLRHPKVRARADVSELASVDE